MFATSVFVDSTYERVRPSYSYDSMTVEAFAAWQREFRDKVSAKLGTKKVREQNAGVPLSPTMIAEAEFGQYVCQTWYITSEPGIHVPFYFFLPSKDAKNCPTLIVLHGHNAIGKEVFVNEGTNEYGLVLAALSQGYAVIAPDVRGFGELKREEEEASSKPNSCEELQRRALMLGRTLVGDRVHDAMRLVDFAMERPVVDPTQIIVNGHSGGGTVSLFTGAVDTRIAAVIPASYFCSFHASIISIRHCMCNVIPGIVELGEMQEIALLSAPRPMLFIHGKDDPIFPVEATMESFSQVKDVYQQLGVEARCQLHVGNYGHVIDDEPMWPFLASVKDGFQ